jgi:hypothetical protein
MPKARRHSGRLEPKVVRPAAIGRRPDASGSLAQCKNDDHDHVNLGSWANNDCKIGEKSLKVPALCDIFGIHEESNAFTAMLQCESRSVHDSSSVISNLSKAAHSSSQRSFNDWQHSSSSQLPIRIKSPMHPPPASGSFLS